MTTVKTSTPHSPETGDLVATQEALAKWRDAIQYMPSWRQELRAGIRPALLAIGEALLCAVAITIFGIIETITLVATFLVGTGADQDYSIGTPPIHVPATWIIWAAYGGSGILLLAMVGVVIHAAIHFVRDKGSQELRKRAHKAGITTISGGM